MISVIVPVYKAEKYLNRCVESVVNQTYRDLEIILVDDGSPDRSPELCDIWARKDKRIKVIHKKNGGASSARNMGLNVAMGDYVAFVDADDYISRDMFEVMSDAAVRNKVDVVSCGRVRVGVNGNTELFTLNQEKCFSGKEALKEFFKGTCFDDASWDKLYCRELFSNLRFKEGETNEDLVPAVRILGSCNKVVHTGKPLYFYCENSESVTGSGFNAGKMIVLRHLEEVKTYVSENYPDLLGYYMVLENRYCLSMMYALLDDKDVFNSYVSERKKVLSIFRSGFVKRNIRKYLSLNERVKGWLIYFNLYYFLHEVRNRK